jgi:hypothetical protein
MGDRDHYRKLVVSAFELICLWGVLIITAGCAIIAANSIKAGDGLLNPVLLVLVGFVSSCFVFGGALTLLDIARSLERLVALASKQEPPAGEDEPPDLEPA